MARTCEYCSKEGCYSMCKDGIRARNKLWADKNKEVVAERIKRWKRNNAAKNAEQCRARRQKITMRSFVHEMDRMNSFYEHAATLRRDLPQFNYVVDHVVPLTHPLVCGLHVVANLRLIPERINLSKGNKFDV